MKMTNCPLKKRVEMSGIFSSKIEYITEEDCDGVVSEKIKESGKKILPAFGFEFNHRPMDV